MKCDLCQTAEAQFLVGNLETGDQVAYCVPDFARFGLDAAQAVLPAEEIASRLGLPPSGPANGQAETPAEATKRPKGSKGKSKTEAAQEPAPGLVEVPAGPADK